MKRTARLLCLLALPACSAVRMATPWTRDVDPAHPWPQYPRPHMVRSAWLNLNGPWQFEGTLLKDPPPARDLKGTIQVPYSMESDLSGVAAHHDRAWYRRSFTLPSGWSGSDVLLHFGASDWETEVFVNGKSVGVHQGGYDAFRFDITPFLVAGPNDLALRVWDPTGKPGEAAFQPMGKQSREPGGIFYTPTSGPWQTVWMEPVPRVRIDEVVSVPGVREGRLMVRATLHGASSTAMVQVEARDRLGKVYRDSVRAGSDALVAIPSPILWSPSDPHLYRLSVRLVDGGRTVDSVGSYAGMRTVGVKRVGGFDRFVLNDEKIFLAGPLDQGYWPDGVYTPATDEAMKADLAGMKNWGFNMVRKHIKVEPERWYWYADSLGLVVWQDMVCATPFGPAPQGEAKSIFEREMRRTIQGRMHHPSIAMWIVFNEGWAQFDDPDMTRLAMSLDTTRLVNEASGWNFHHRGEVKDFHSYEINPICPPAENGWMTAVGEFGGIGLHWPDHEWSTAATYRWVDDSRQLLSAWTGTFEDLRHCVETQGLSAAVATQWSDVEMELNGFWTYDRKFPKLDSIGFRREVSRLVAEEPMGTLFVPTSQASPQSWRFTTTEPPAGWNAKEFADGAWKSAPGGFGTRETPLLALGTLWTGTDIWMRRTARLPYLTGPQIDSLRVYAFHDEDMEVYINGALAVKTTGYTQGYHWFRSEPAAKAALLPGQDNVIAVHCRQKAGGQGIDVGLGTRERAATSSNATPPPRERTPRLVGEGILFPRGEGRPYAIRDPRGRILSQGTVGPEGIVRRPDRAGLVLVGILGDPDGWKTLLLP